MDEPKNRRTDQHGPKTPLRWGERWTLLLTGPTSGIVGQYGATWPGQPAHYEHVNVYAEGAAKLDDIEQYRLQMAAICTASFGYWKEVDSIHPDYDTVPLRDVARLYAKYEELHAFRESVRRMVQLLKNREWAEDLGATGDAAELQAVITELVGAVRPRMPGDWSVTWDEYSPPDTIRLNSPKWGGCFLRPPEPHHIGLHAITYRMLSDFLTPAAPVAPDAVDAGDSKVRRETGPGYDLRVRGANVFGKVQEGAVLPPHLRPRCAVEAAFADAVVHGTGAFTVNADGSTEHVDLHAKTRAAAEIVAFSPPPMVRDALYHDYAVPKQEGDPE